MMTLLVEGKIDSYLNYNQDLKKPGGPEGNKVTETYNAVCSFGEDCLFTDKYKYPTTMIAKERSFVLTLQKKDFSEVLYYRRVDQKVQYLKFLMSTPIVQSVPFHISQEMSE
jgi:hypothetical protein